MKLKTYIVNLEKSVVRKQYMQDLLHRYDFLDIEFIKAIDGRLMSDTQRKAQFDYDASMKHYGRYLNEGEVGCALSHRICYKALLDSDNPYAMVLEDDISIIRKWDTLPWADIDKLLDVSKPRVLFLSGDYWRLSSKCITPVFDAVGAYAYIINRAAAKAIISIKNPYVVADDWLAYKRLGIKLFAIYPYAADANLVENLTSDVQQDSWMTDHALMSKLELARRAFPAFVKHIMKKAGLFESKFRG